MAPPSIQTCPSRTEEVPLEIEGRLVGVIEREPLFPQAAPAQRLKSAKKSGGVSFYVDSLTSNACFYPLRFNEAFPLDPQTILPGKFQTGPLNFGVPTRLKTQSQNLDGALYDPFNDLYYAQTFDRTTWFLVGGEKHREYFARGILNYSGFLERLWSNNPADVLFNSPWHADRPEATPNMEIEEAVPLILSFLKWLERFDPGLHREIAGRLEFRGHPKLSSLKDRILCGQLFSESSYAIYEPRTKQIVLLPPALQFLKQGHFETVAQILSHESAHHSSLESGLIMPTHELLARSLSHFFQKLSEGNPLEAWLVRHFGGLMFYAGQCNLMPLSPEEEAQAHAKEVAYALSRSHDRIDSDLVEESLDVTDMIWTKLRTHYPPEWTGLASVYFSLAGEQQPIWLVNSPRAKKFLKLFEQDLSARLNCTDKAGWACASPSPAMKALRRIPQDHREKISNGGSLHPLTRSKPWLK